MSCIGGVGRPQQRLSLVEAKETTACNDAADRSTEPDAQVRVVSGAFATCLTVGSFSLGLESELRESSHIMSDGAAPKC